MLVIYGSVMKLHLYCAITQKLNSSGSLRSTIIDLCLHIMDIKINKLYKIAKNAFIRYAYSFPLIPVLMKTQNL
jgi:hypothetical protein